MRLGYLYSRYPVLSQTFCDTEMLELERRGHEIVLASLYPPKTAVRHEYLAKLRAAIHYAPDSPALERRARKAKREGRWPEKLIAAHAKKYGPAYKAALRARNAFFFVDLFEREKIRHIHVHFANRAAHTALFVKEISGIPFSITAHGQDFLSDLGSLELLREICAGAEFIGAETDWSRDLLARHCPDSASKIFRVYNGIDLTRYPLPKDDLPSVPVTFLSVGRLVPFKGFDALLKACALLRDRGVSFRLEIIGDGPLREELGKTASENSLKEFVTFAGERAQAEVLTALQRCDVFVLAARVDELGASDVFPTVIAEAMASARAVISTTVAGIPELVAENVTGLLVHPADIPALAAAMATMANDRKQRRAFGRAGRERIEQNFAIAETIAPLLQRFDQSAARSH